MGGFKNTQAKGQPQAAGGVAMKNEDNSTLIRLGLMRKGGWGEKPSASPQGIVSTAVQGG